MFGDDWNKEDWAIVILVFAMFAGIIGLQIYYTQENNYDRTKTT